MNKIRKQMLAMAEDGFQSKALCNVVAAVVGGAVVSSAVGAYASKSAANTEAGAATTAAGAQLQATQETNALNYNIYQQNLANTSPYLQVSQEAESALASGLGLGAPNAGTLQTGVSGPAGPQQQGQIYGAANPSGSGSASIGSAGYAAMPGSASGVPTANVSQGLGGSGVPLTATTQAVPSSALGGSALTGTSPTGSNVGQSTTTNNIPGIGNVGVVNAGATSSQLAQGASSQAPGSLLANFNNTDLNSQLNPSYGFILGQGTQQLTNYDAAHGISGGAAAQDQTAYAENTASTYYQQAFSNYLTQQNQNINSLSSLAGNGAVNSANSAGTSAANSITSNTQAGVAASNNYLTSGASAEAAGDIGASNAISGAIGNGTSGLLTAQLINKSAYTPAATAGLGG